MYSIVEKGSLYATDYRLFICDKHGPISPAHDIPLYADEENKIFNMVVEIPRWTCAKMEIAMNEKLNPIKQDTLAHGELRYLPNLFPQRGVIWNYGALPQTWENPDVIDAATGFKGDNDPVDVVEIGNKVAERGEVLQVKVLGAIGLIDQDPC